MIHAIRYAYSEDGVNWVRNPSVCLLPDADQNEYAFTRPTVIKDQDIYQMWFSYRIKGEDSYLLGYAESRDKIAWVRKERPIQLTVNASQWDSDMACYPFAFSFNEKQYLLYNGNGFGATGFGLVSLEKNESQK